MKSKRITVPNDLLIGEVARILAQNREVILLTKGGSMLPFIIGGTDSVRLRRYDSYNVGDAVLAKVSTGHHVLHRIISIDGENVVLKGDGNLSGTEMCRMSDICGRAVGVIRKNGREIDSTTPAYMKRVRFWNNLPYFVRRYTIAIIRRIICVY